MKFTALTQFLMPALSAGSDTDPLWNNVTLLCRFDKESNTRGLPFYRDYSRYQYQVRELVGTNSNSIFQILDADDSNYPLFPTTADVTVASYGYINNGANQAARIAELNGITVDDFSAPEAIVQPSYLEILQNGNPYHTLGTSDFTIEFSFFADEVALPWQYQCLFHVGGCLQFNGENPTPSSIGTKYQPYNGNGYGMFLRNSDLVFLARGTAYKINTSALVRKTWYHVAVQRVGNNLKCYLNSELTQTYSFSANLTFTIGNAEDTNQYRMRIGAHRYLRRGTSSLTYTAQNSIDSSFSGGISNLRLTQAARYPQSFYTLKLPFVTLDVDNKIDSYYNDTLFNIPLNYDLFDYSKHLAHFTNQTLLRQAVNFATGFLYLDGLNTYTTRNISTNLDSDEFTLEFYLAPFLDTQPYDIAPDDANRNFYQFFFTDYNLAYVNGEFERVIPLINLTSDDNKVLEVGCRIIYTRNSFYDRGGLYFYLKVSENGTDWLTFLSEADINWNDFTSIPTKLLPDNELKFYAQYSGSIDGLDNVPTPTNFAYDEPNCHLAIQRYSNVLYFLLNGSVIHSVSFANSIYQSSNNLELSIGGAFDEIRGGKTSGSTLISQNRLGLGIKGIRLTNAARYSTVTTNNYPYDHSLQPLALESGKLAPARTRIVAILKSSLTVSVSSDEVSWYVYWNQPVSNLVLEDFTLTQLDGVTGSSLVSLTKLSDYEYEVIADSGTGNGTLRLNFTDRKTVLYPGTADTISNAVGELNFEGETYLINKAAPVAVLTSGSSPYIRNSFLVSLQFTGSISQFYPENIGVSNGRLKSTRLVDELTSQYELVIEPTRAGVVIVQALQGTAQTNTGIFSAQSAPLVRVYSESFPILQAPLNQSTGVLDYSPNRLTLEEIIANNTSFSTTVFPLGESSSLDVQPLLEQGGLTYEDFNAVGSLLSEELGTDFTIEFYLRINSTVNSKKSHILSVENASSGFCVIADNGYLKLLRSVTAQTNLLGSATIKEIDTPTYVDWDDEDYTTGQKYPHFAITRKGNTYRLYRNGIRQAIFETATPLDITKGDLFLGYYPNRVDDVPYYLSNVRLTYGKALYTAYQVSIPPLPFTVLPNIAEETELLNYVSIYSSNANSDQAALGDTITLKFTSILPLAQTPIVTILGRTPEQLTVLENNSYVATLAVLLSDADQVVPFSISIENQPGIPDREFTDTTNDSRVIIDQTPLSITVSTTEPNNSNYRFRSEISFSEPPNSFALTNINISNGMVSNLIRYSDTLYSVDVVGSSNGVLDIKVDANEVVDLAGNYNLESNTLSRTVAVPAYIPDPHWDDVLLLIQPQGGTVVDESSYSNALTLNNVTLSTATSPAGLAQSLYFNGESSSLTFDLNQTLPSSSDYTIELYLYISSSAVFRLANPVALPGTQVTADSFTSNWESVTDASSYLLDLATEASFSEYVPGFRGKNVGDTTEFSIEADNLAAAPTADAGTLIAPHGFVGTWDYSLDALGYALDVSLDDDFTQPLYLYSNKFLETPFALVENLRNLTEVPVEAESEPEAETGYVLEQGVILNGILTNANYPKLYYFLEESSLRLYKNNEYSMPAIAEDMDAMQWVHIAISNTTKYTYLYIDGELKDKIRNVGFATDFDIGYDIGRFRGYLQSLRITKGTARYLTSNFEPPPVPLPIS